jgi:hypothetical protein
MNPSPEIVKLAQTLLNKRAKTPLVVDGAFGPKSQAEAARQIRWTFRGTPTAVRWVAAVIQSEARARSIDAGALDAFYGPQTDAAARQMLGEAAPRPDERPASQGPRCWSPTDAQMTTRYGGVGTNQVRANIPFPLRLDWDLKTQITGFSCHRLVKDDVESIFLAILRAYGIERIRQLGIDRFGGCLNVRRKRGGTTWSAHAWGTAIDLYPSMNQLHWTRKQAVFARSEYEALRRIFADHGWMSLGSCYDFDWMHWQKNP